MTINGQPWRLSLLSLHRAKKQGVRFRMDAFDELALDDFARLLWVGMLHSNAEATMDDAEAIMAAEDFDDAEAFAAISDALTALVSRNRGAAGPPVGED